MAEEAKPDPLANAGASAKDLSEGQGLEGAPKAPPEPSNAPPAKEGRDETFADGDPSKPQEKGKEGEGDKKPAEPPKPADPPDLGNYITSDDPYIQGVVDVLKEAGVHQRDADKFFDKAKKSGDLADIDWAEIEAKVGKAKAFIIQSGVTSYYNNLQAQVQATVKQTHEIFGGAQNFDAVKVWAQTKEKGDPAFGAQVDAIRDLLNEGGAKAAAGARELLRLYNSDGGTKGLDAVKLVTGNSTGTVIGTPLTRADYITELKAAHDRRASPQELAAIDARRKAGMAKGI